MKFKKLIVSGIIMNVLAMSIVPGVYAAPKKGWMPPGQMKKTVEKNDDIVEYIINNGKSLPPGILKNLIRDSKLSNDDIEDLMEAGALNGVPGGILKNIMSDKDDDIEDQDSEDENDVLGRITGIDLEDRIIVVDGLEYKLPKEVDVEMYGEDAKLSDLKVGMKVEIELDEEEAEINVIEDDKDGEIISGSITAIDLDDKIIVIDKVEYNLPDGTYIEIDGGLASIEDLEVGMKIEIEVDNDKEEMDILVIDEENVKRFKGIIKELDLIGNYYIMIDDTEHKLSKDAVVLIDGDSKKLSDLKVGVEANIKIVDDEVVSIIISTFDYEKVFGEIIDIDLIGTYHIKIDTEVYKLNEEAKIFIDGNQSSLNDLKSGMEIEAKLDSDDIVAITTLTEGFDKKNGKIEELDLFGQYHIALGEDEYILSKDSKVIIDEEIKELKDLRIGMEVEAKIFDNQVVIVTATIAEEKNVSGELKDIDLIGTYHIKIDNDEYELSKDTKVIIEDRDRKLEDLEIGMEVNVEIVDDIVFKIVVE